MPRTTRNRGRAATSSTRCGVPSSAGGRSANTRLFIGGIMQGSIREMAIHDQDYRDVIASIVRRYHPEVAIIDPRSLHPDSVCYGREEAVDTFLAMLDEAAAADILIAYLPEASLGTALEIWQAYQAGKPVLVISPMANNWMLWATATNVLPDLAAFESFVREGGLEPYLGGYEPRGA